ncbi:unnamed protein product [Nezara viridula]|uniref:Uncharacterized protein n=1 Tax=Nezara viridula TaxID=85310 RepID=A0A9P0E558_NEZVI|nr:unnamed protein product [Nezara viridula]
MLSIISSSIIYKKVAGADPYYQPQQPSAAPQYYQPQQQYQPQPQAAPPRKLVRPAAREEEEVAELPADYQFGFNVKDDLFTNYQKRKEQREGNKITGSYSVVDADGFIRTVTYTADPIEGFKADVKREPTDIKIRFPQPALPGPGQEQAQYQPQAGPSARKQQTQQYLQASAPQPQQQYSLRPEQGQAYSGIPQGYSPQAYQQ